MEEDRHMHRLVCGQTQKKQQPCRKCSSPSPKHHSYDTSLNCEVTTVVHQVQHHVCLEDGGQCTCTVVDEQNVWQAPTYQGMYVVVRASTPGNSTQFDEHWKRWERQLCATKMEARGRCTLRRVGGLLVHLSSQYAGAKRANTYQTIFQELHSYSYTVYVLESNLYGCCHKCYGNVST